MTQRVLVLDDDPNRLPWFTQALVKPGITFAVARTARDAIELLDAHHWDIVFLDHDLGLTPDPDPGDGSQVADYITKAHHYRGRFKKTKFYIHSLNPEGRRGMVRWLKRTGLKVYDAPSVWERIQ